MKRRRRRSASRTNGHSVASSTFARCTWRPSPCWESMTFAVWLRPARTHPITDAAWRLRNGRRERTEWDWRSRSRPRSAVALLGEHDFRGLAAAGANTPHYRCRVALAQWAPRADGVGLAFTVEADRFLHHMVRFIVGTMVDIALGRRPPDDFPSLLVATDNLAASPPAPPQGLYLEAVRYPPDLYAEASTS